MKHTDGDKTRYGAWRDEETQQYFSFSLESGAEYVEFDDYKLKIRSISGIEEFDATIKVSVNPNFTTTGNAKQTTLEKLIHIHFTNNIKSQICLGP